MSGEPTYQDAVVGARVEIARKKPPDRVPDLEQAKVTVFDHRSSSMRGI
jgi:hypothetical protein